MTYRLQSEKKLAVKAKSKVLVVDQSHKAACLSWSSLDTGVSKKQGPGPVKEWLYWQGKGKQAKNQ